MNSFIPWIKRGGTGGRSVEDVYSRYPDNARQVIAQAEQDGTVIVVNRWHRTGGYALYVEINKGESYEYRNWNQHV